MNVTVQAVPEMTLEEFADEHGLEMDVVERRSPSRPHMRYYAFFKGVDVRTDRMLHSVYGNGETPDKAIQDYIPKISLANIVVSIHGQERREIRVPRLVPASGESAQPPKTTGEVDGFQ